MIEAADLLLASGSPRRKELLEQIGVRYITCPMDIDETHQAQETADEYVMRLSLEKAQAGLKLNGKLPVLGADTSVVINGKILGKPESEDHAVAMLMALSGGTHTVMTGVALIRNYNGECQIQNMVVETKVTFLPITDTQIRQYVATQEPMDKAGGYGIQGKAAIFVEKIEGSYSNVVGLPLEQVGIMLQRFNIPIWQA